MWTSERRRLQERTRVAELEQDWMSDPSTAGMGILFGRPIPHPQRLVRLARRNRFGRLRGTGYTRAMRKGRHPRGWLAGPPRTATVIPFPPKQRTLRERARGMFKRALRRAA